MKKSKTSHTSTPSYKEVRAEVLQWLGPKMRKRMRELSLSEPALEKLTGIGASTISDYLMGRYEPSLSKIILLSHALKVNWEFFFEKDAGIPEPERKAAMFGRPVPASIAR